MAAHGCFLEGEQPEGGGEPRRRFVLKGAPELEVDANSVSSEWITESEAETPGCEGGAQGQNATGEEKKARKRVRLWRVKHRLRHVSDADGSGQSSSTASSSSSSTTTSTGSSSASSSSSSNSIVGAPKRLRQERGGEAGSCTEGGPSATEAQGRDLEGVARPPAEAPAAPPGDAAGGQCAAALRWLGSRKRYRCLAFAPGFLSEEDIGALHGAAKHPSVREIHDRKGYLAFKHRVWRFELQLRSLEPELYRRLLQLMHQADDEKWSSLRKSRKKGKVYPEVEYIDYDVEYEGKPCFIEPHVDNKSAITLVAMLSPPADYVGGRSCFRRCEGRKGHRELSLQMGDAVLFRGEKLLHWITPVTSGRRVILQIELSRV